MAFRILKIKKVYLSETKEYGNRYEGNNFYIDIGGVARAKNCSRICLTMFRPNSFTQLSTKHQRVRLFKNESFVGIEVIPA